MIRAKDVPDYYSFVYVTFSFPPSELGNPIYIESQVASPGTPNQHDIATLLGRPAGAGCILNDGPGDLLIDVSYDGQTFTEDIRLKNIEIFDITGLRIYKLRIDATAPNTKYRILAI